MKSYSRVRFFGSLGHEYVEDSVWELVKSFVSLHPADVSLGDCKVVYSIPPSQISRPVLHDTCYQIETDFRERYLQPTMTVGLRQHTSFRCDMPNWSGIDVKPILIDDHSGFRMIPNAVYSDVEITSRECHIVNIYYGREWKWSFREVHRYPYRTPGNDSRIYFQYPGKKVIELLCDTDDNRLILNYLRVALPDKFNKFV